MRTLAIRPGAIGDFIVSLPALESLKTGYLEIWTASPHVKLARFADCVRPISSTGLDLLGITEPPRRLLEELRGFDRIVSWYGANRDEFRELTRALSLPFLFFPALPPDGAGHATDFYLRQVATLPQTRPAPAEPRIPCPEAPCENFAVIHPYSGSSKKNWPLEKFVSCARRLERLTPVHWCAGPDDPPLERFLAGAALDSAKSVVRVNDLYELACWLARARLYLGNDSGITHLAAAVGTPVLALFGPTDPAVWAPRGSNVRVALWSRT